MSKKRGFAGGFPSVRIEVMNSSPDLFSTIEKGSTRVLFLDTETTGPDPSAAEVCEVAFILAEYSGFTETGSCRRFESLVKPSAPIPPEASAVNGISNRMVQEAPAAADIRDHVESIASEADYIAAHNLPYDYTILKRQYPGVFSRFSPNAHIDTLRLSRHIWQEIPSHSLQALRYRFELDLSLQGDAHRAMFDTELVRELLHHSFRQPQLNQVMDDWNGLVELIASPLEVKIFSFGKYRGSLVEDTVAGDPDYIRWLIRQKWLSEEHPDLYHTILRKAGNSK